ncbi:hypothetical protein GCM10008956_06600 [Deinococcus arenae]|uniref:Uncharacterized protein n=1 Tax=Deinococcus arenae TaxID=1452751 RepID=A0A8H9GKG8_9DEIO|nr:hypothetical protein [Deinococcus arenae]AWT35649.1 hypothetical protein DM785_08815 [Deinococcus actinosclerus]GGM33016.1 hypothetical protein GCM10008956_06600 [Deinococcus arenae]
MTPEEWNVGIRNEADSVQDTHWSQDTRRHLRRRAWLTATAITLGFTATMLVLAILLNAALFGVLPGTNATLNGALWNQFSIGWLFVAGLGSLMSRRGFTPLQATAGLLTAMILGSVVARLVTLDVHVSFPEGMNGTFDLLPGPTSVSIGSLLIPVAANIAALGVGFLLARATSGRRQPA